MAWAEGAGVDRWEDSTVRIGRALGKEARAKRLVAAFRARAAKARKTHPEFGVLDADVVVATSPSARELKKLSGDALLGGLPAVREKRYLALAVGDATSIAFPSVLSVDDALDKIVPRLSSALR